MAEMQGWSDVDIKMGLKPRPNPNEGPKKELSLTTIIIAGVVLWLVIFGGMFAWMAFSPCSFLRFILTPEVLTGYQARQIDITNPDVCRAVLQGRVGG